MLKLKSGSFCYLHVGAVLDGCRASCQVTYMSEQYWTDVVHHVKLPTCRSSVGRMPCIMSSYLHVGAVLDGCRASCHMLMNYLKLFLHFSCTVILNYTQVISHRPPPENIRNYYYYYYHYYRPQWHIVRASVLWRSESMLRRQQRWNKTNCFYNVTNRCHIMPNSFSVCAA